jgi:DNA-binding transcriptional ArsR family regulator
LDEFQNDFSSEFHWTKKGLRWTEARGTPALLGIRSAQRCKDAISTAQDRALLTIRKSALWCVPRTRRRGRAFVPQDAATGRFQLKPAQQQVLDALPARGDSELTRAQYEELAGVSRSQAAYDLAELVEAGILHRVGNGRATRYRLDRAREGGGQRRWTSERIRAELEAFCAGRATWPSAAEFKAADRGDLYVAASRYGGIGQWADELGFNRPRGSTSSTPERPSLRGRIAWAGAGALAALGVAAAVGGVVFSFTRDAPPVASPPTAPAGATSGAVAERQASQPLRLPEKRRTTVRKARRQRQQQRQQIAPARHPRRTSATPVSRTSSPHSSSPTGRSNSTAPTVTRQYMSAGAAPSGPVPLRAPSTSSAPAPIKAP